MSLLNKASLIQIPSGYKDGTLYSAKPTNGDGDFTFSRGSNLAATRVNSDGLIEKGRENLAVRSNDFVNWNSSVSISFTSGQTGYDGSSDAWKIDLTAAGGRVQNSNNTSGVHTFSVYAKAGTLNWVRMITNSSSTQDMYFDLANGVLGTSTYGGQIDATITSVGNGWYRCTLTDDKALFNIRIYPAQDDGDLTATSGNIYIQDAQLEQGLVATNYIETTTTTAQAGILEDMPRLDYSGGATCPSLLLEPSRTQLLPQSEYANSSDWNNGSTTYENNAATSPEGVDNAIKLSENDTVSSFHYLGSQKTGVSTAGDYTISGFIKKGSRRYAGLRGVTNGFVNRYFVLVDLNDGSVVDTNTFGSGVTWSHNVSEYANGWYRIEITGGHTSGTIDATFGLSNSDSPSYTGGLPVYNGTNGEHIFCYGIMIEAGSYPTSYIPTYGSGASVTRGADAASDSNVTPTSNKATLYIEINGNNDSENRNVCGFRNAATNQYALYFWGADNKQFGFNTWNGDSYGITNSTIFNGDLHKIAAVFDFTDFTQNALFIDGVKQSISQVRGTTVQRTANKVSLIAPNPNQNPIQDIHKFISFDSALTDAECIQLTS